MFTALVTLTCPFSRSPIQNSLVSSSPSAAKLLNSTAGAGRASTRGTAPIAALKASLQQAGAYDVHIAPRIIPKAVQMNTAVATATTDEGMVTAFWQAMPEDVRPSAEQQQRCLRKLKTLQELRERTAA